MDKRESGDFMAKYIVKRLFAGALTIVVLITIAFFLMHMMPGSPFSGEQQKKLTVEGLARLKEKYGLDRPVWEQYLTYWKGLLKFDFGTSFKKPDTTANEIIFDHFPISAQVGGIAVFVSLLIGTPAVRTTRSPHFTMPASTALSTACSNSSLLLCFSSNSMGMTPQDIASWR
jgi:oligopeptide transport system permease protein